MAGKKTTQSSSSKSISGGTKNGDMQSNNHNNGNHQTETAHREEILRLLSQDLVSLQYARVAWLESLERDLRRIRLDLEAAETALSGGNRCGNGKNQLKRKRNGL